MRKSLLLIISALSFLVSQNVQAQCPSAAGTTINTCDFAAGGEITVIFTDGNQTNQEGYILFDVSGGTPSAVSEPFGPVTKSYNAGTQTLVFGIIPDGTYLIGRSGCPTLGGFGIIIDQTNELILSVNSITPDCDNLGSGAIDLTTTGGDAPYTYTWTPALPDQEDQTGLSAGSYDVTVTDSDNCTSTITGIIVPTGPAFQDINNANPSAVCSGDDLVVGLNGSELGVTYEVIVDGVASGITEAGTGNALTLTLPSGSFVDGDLIAVEANDGSCPVISMNNSFTVNVTTIALQNVSNTDPFNVCPGDDVIVSLDNSEGATVTYEVLLDGAPTGITETGVNGSLNITLPNGSYTNGQEVTVEATLNGCSLLMSGSFTISINNIAIQNLTNTDPEFVCAGDDLIVTLGDSEIGVTYEVLVDGVASGATAAGDGNPLAITLPSANFANGNTITVQGQIGTCPPVAMTGSFDVTIQSVTPQVVNNTDPTAVCSGDDLVVGLDGSEVGVTYEILVDGVASGVTAAGTGGALNITLPSANFANGNSISVEGNIGGSCTTAMTGSFTVNVTTIALQNVTNTDPFNVCSGDDLIVSLDNSEGATVTYEVLLDGAATGITAAGVGGNLDITVPSGSFVNGQIVTVEASSNGCTLLMAGSFEVNIQSVTPQVVNNTDPTAVCSGDDLVVGLDGSEVGVVYEILVDGAASGVTAAGTGGALNITLPNSDFNSGNQISIIGTANSCVVDMIGSFTVQVVIQDLTAIVNNTTGCGIADGSIDLTVSSTIGGDTFTFNWTGPSGFTSAQEDLTNLAGGDYRVRVTSNTTGCIDSADFTVIDPVPFTLDNFVNTDQTQCSVDDGSISFDVTGGTGPFNYYIINTTTNLEVVGSRSDNDANASYSFGALAPGSYEVFVEDGACTLGTPFVVAPVNQITAVVSNTTDASCGAADGAIELTIADVGNDYDVILSDGTNVLSTSTETAGTTTVNLTGLGFGNYVITVVDNTTNCEVVINQSVAENASFTIDTETVTDITTCGGSEGSITLDISGLVGPTTYTWTGPAGFTDPGTEDLSNLDIAGTYEVTIVDNGCTVVRSYDITAPAQPFAGDYVGTPGTATLANNPYDLFTLLENNPDPNGAWTLSNSANGGGVDPSFDASTGVVDFSAAAGGTYTFTYTVTTIPSCTDSEDVVVEFTEFECADTRFSVITEEATCSGVQDGAIFLFLQSVSNSANLQAVIGGTDTLTFANPGNGSLVQLDSAFTSGNYQVTLYDPINGCSNTRTVTIGQKQSITPSINKTDATCDNPVGQIQVTLDGTFNFTLLDETDTQLTSNATGVFNGLVPGTYGVAFENTGSQICQVDTVRNIVINNPLAVSDGALDVTVVAPDCSTADAQVIINFSLSGTYFYEVIDTAGAVVDSLTTNAGNLTFDLDTLGTFNLNVTNVDNPGICEPNARTFSINRAGGFTATADQVTNISCFGDETGTAVITLEGLSTAYYSVDNGNLWIEFTSGNTIENLPAINNLLVTDNPGNSTCVLTVPVNITYESQPIILDGDITLITQASCTTAEEIGEIQIPQVEGGVLPYTFFIDDTEVSLDANRVIGGLSRNVTNLIVVDNVGCSETFPIANIVSPNEVRAIVEEIDPNENCLEQPEGLRITIDQNTVDNVTGPYNFIINVVDASETTEFTLDVDANGSNEFLIGPNEDITFDFEKGTRYRWTLRSVTNEQACSADNFITIRAGAIVPRFTLEGVDAQCFGQSGAIELTDIEADEDLPLTIKLFNDRDDLIDQFDLASVPFSQSFIIDENNFGKVEAGVYHVILQQQPQNCTDSIVSEYLEAIVDAPSGELLAKLTDEPFRPEPPLTRNEMNPMPTTRPDRADGSITIELVSKSSATSYSAQIFEVRTLPGSGVTLQEMRDQLPTAPIEFGANDMITFEGLYPGVYSIEYYDSFGCGEQGSRLIAGNDGTFEITVDFDRAPFIPNVFTPDGDGINDQFEILNLSDAGNEMIITNRTGTVVYRNLNYRPADLWDGGDQPSGVYFYQLTTDDKQVYTGWIEIVRNRNNK